MQGGNQRCQASLGCSGASTPHCSKIPSGKKGSAGAARAQTPALLRMLNLGSAMQEEARRGFAGDGSLCTQNFWLDFFCWAVRSKQENSQEAAALGLNPAAALPWLVPPGRKKTEKASRKCCKKKKVLGIALCQGLMRKVQGFLSKLLNFIMCGGKYLSPCLYFSSVHWGTVKFLVFFCQRLGWPSSFWGWKIFCPAVTSAQAKGGEGESFGSSKLCSSFLFSS